MNKDNILYFINFYKKVTNDTASSKIEKIQQILSEMKDSDEITEKTSLAILNAIEVTEVDKSEEKILESVSKLSADELQDLEQTLAFFLPSRRSHEREKSTIQDVESIVLTAIKGNLIDAFKGEETHIKSLYTCNPSYDIQLADLHFKKITDDFGLSAADVYQFLKRCSFLSNPPVFMSSNNLNDTEYKLASKFTNNNYLYDYGNKFKKIELSRMILRSILIPVLLECEKDNDSNNNIFYNILLKLTKEFDINYGTCSYFYEKENKETIQQFITLFQKKFPLFKNAEKSAPYLRVKNGNLFRFMLPSLPEETLINYTINLNETDRTNFINEEINGSIFSQNNIFTYEPIVDPDFIKNIRFEHMVKMFATPFAMTGHIEKEALKAMLNMFDHFYGRHNDNIKFRYLSSKFLDKNKNDQSIQLDEFYDWIAKDSEYNKLTVLKDFLKKVIDLKNKIIEKYLVTYLIPDITGLTLSYLSYNDAKSSTKESVNQHEEKMIEENINSNTASHDVMSETRSQLRKQYESISKQIIYLRTTTTENNYLLDGLGKQLENAFNNLRLRIVKDLDVQDRSEFVKELSALQTEIKTQLEFLNTNVISNERYSKIWLETGGQVNIQDISELLDTMRSFVSETLKEITHSISMETKKESKHDRKNSQTFTSRQTLFSSSSSSSSGDDLNSPPPTYHPKK